jgi:hypothetical protein
VLEFGELPNPKPKTGIGLLIMATRRLKWW